ncbi:MAG: hypothetical protein IPJ69_06865 [Deltaproteobacteria bacterium]|nr:MAG: hypothetical protein IPJ69_06865 [Deltaproteobacteria bacterium]
MNIVNYESGEVVLEESGVSVRLSREDSHRLILMARMHTVPEFINLLPSFVSNEEMLKAIQQKFSATESSTDRWNLKEKFARLTTLTKGYISKNPEALLEKITF